MRTRILAALLCVFAGGCIVEAPGSTRPGKGDAAAAAAKVVAATAPLNLKNGAILDDKVEIVDVTFEPGRALPGEAVRVTAQYRVLAEIPQDYLIFVHVEDVKGKLERMNVDHAPVGGRRPTSTWKPGEIIQDAFTVNVPAEGRLEGLNLWAGFWHAQTDTRLALKNPNAVRNDGRDRILLGTLRVGR